MYVCVCGGVCMCEREYVHVCIYVRGRVNVRVFV